MRPYRLHLFFLAFCWCFGPRVNAQNSPIFTVFDSLPQLESRISKAGNATLIIKFWATWCKPCVEELPLFEEYNQRYAGQNVQVVLVSLDFKSQLQKKFIPFLETAKLKSEIILFADQDANTWIPRVNEEWDGAIPATLVVQGKKNNFHQGKFKDFADLETFVQPFRVGVHTADAATGRK